MEYILKSSAILTIFYLFYKIFLQRETFFNSIRSYFLTGIISAIILPFIVITKYIQVDPIAIPTNMVFTEVSTLAPTSVFNWIQLIFIIYLTGIIFFSLRFLWQLSSLIWFLYTHPKSKKGKYILVKTTKNMAPFSFFNYIAYNRNQFDDKELESILKHEKVHANQLHSIDIILSQIIAIVNWFNPFIWMYHKEIQKNLEYVADEFAHSFSQGKKNYQYLLLKIISPDYKMALTSNFYNTIIKKRIDMLQKNRSSKTTQIKFALIIPILIAFVFTYNTEIVAQTTKTTKVQKSTEKNVELQEVVEQEEILEVQETQELKEVQEVKEIIEVKETRQLKEVKVHEIIEIEQNHLAFIINKDNSEYDLNKLKTDALNEGVKLKIKGVKRNSKGEITAIKIDVRSDNSSANFNTNSDKPIKPIKISFGENGGDISIGNVSSIHKNGVFFVSNDWKNKGLVNTYVISSGKEGNSFIRSEGKGNAIYEFKISDDDHVWITKETDSTIPWGSINLVRRWDTTYTYQNGGTIPHNKNLVVIGRKVHKNDDDSQIIDIIIDEESNDIHEKIEFIIKTDDDLHSKDGNVFVIDTDGKKPLLIVDGKEVPYDKMKDISPDGIESINILKGEKATKEYGDKAKDGVIKITTKKK